MQNTTQNMWANNKGFRMADFIKPDPFAHVPAHELAGHERIGKYNARITHADLRGIDPTVDITTPDFDTEAEARTYALNLARQTPRANRVTISRIERHTLTRGLYGEFIDQIESTDAAWQGEATATTRTPVGSMSRTLRRTRRNTLRTAARTTKHLNYRALSGLIAAAVEAGRLIRVTDFLQRIGGADLPDGKVSWLGRHIAKAYRATHGGDSVRVWVQHRTTGKYVHVLVYGPIDEALYTGLHNYKGTRHLLFTEAA